MYKLNLTNDFFEYRILNFEAQKENYSKFIKSLKQRKQDGFSCEYEIEGESLDLFSDKYGFEAQSIIVIFTPYSSCEKLEIAQKSNLSVHACSIDYHKVVKAIANKLAIELCDKYPNLKYHIQCDNGEYNEKFFAMESGLGKWGVNSLVINDIYGSYGFLSLLFTDIAFEEYKTEKTNCINCKKCIDSCPTGAIFENGLNFNKCISYLTQKKHLDENEENILKKQYKIYGCDICQIICPENKNKKSSNIEDFNVDLLYNINLDDVLGLSNKEFKHIYGNRNFSWRGKSIIKRNILIVDNE